MQISAGKYGMALVVGNHEKSLRDDSRRTGLKKKIIAGLKLGQKVGGHFEGDLNTA